MIPVTATRAQIEGHCITEYRGTAKGATFAELLPDSEAWVPTLFSTLTFCMPWILKPSITYHGASAVIRPMDKGQPPLKRRDFLMRALRTAIGEMSRA